MDLLINFCAQALIFAASLYALYRVFYHHSKKHHIRHIVMLTATASGAYFAAEFLKNLIKFPRPDLTDALFTLQDPSSYGLPSGHAAYMFALAATMYSFDRKAGIILYMFAATTGVARVLAGVHFWYDIVGGAVLGYFLSWIIVVLCKRFIRYE